MPEGGGGLGKGWGLWSKTKLWGQTLSNPWDKISIHSSPPRDKVLSSKLPTRAGISIRVRKRICACIWRVFFIAKRKSKTDLHGLPMWFLWLRRIIKCLIESHFCPYNRSDWDCAWQMLLNNSSAFSVIYFRMHANQLMHQSIPPAPRPSPGLTPGN